MLKRRNVGRRRNIKIRRIFKWPSSLPKLERGRGEHSRKLPRYPRRGCYLRILTSETLRSSRRPTSQPLPRFSFLLHASSSLFPPRRGRKVEEWKKVEIKIKIYIYTLLRLWIDKGEHRMQMRTKIFPFYKTSDRLSVVDEYREESENF